MSREQIFIYGGQGEGSRALREGYEEQIFISRDEISVSGDQISVSGEQFFIYGGQCEGYGDEIFISEDEFFISGEQFLVSRGVREASGTMDDSSGHLFSNSKEVAAADGI